MVGEAVAMYWKAIGIDVKIILTDWGTIRTETMGGKANNNLWVFSNPGLIDPVKTLALNYDFSNASCSYATPESTDRLKKINTEIDPEKRTELARQFALFVREEAAQVFLLFVNAPYGVSRKVGNWPTTRIRPGNFEQITH
jgi:ABC-type transport system substrate-binding protein